jgi:hypothetical protein
VKLHPILIELSQHGGRLKRAGCGEQHVSALLGEPRTGNDTFCEILLGLLVGRDIASPSSCSSLSWSL